MNETWTILINNVKAAKSDTARCTRECHAEKTGGYYDRNSCFDYTIEAKIIAKLVETKSDHFANEFYAKMKANKELSDKQSYALAAVFSKIEITFGDVKKAVADCGYDINENFIFED